MHEMLCRDALFIHAPRLEARSVSSRLASTLGWVGGCASILLGACGPGSSVAGTEGDSGTGAQDSGTAGTMVPDSSTGGDAADGATNDATADATGADTAADGSPETGAGMTDGGSVDANCCLPHEGPGCNEPAVETCVCAVDANCCVFAWDGVCATAAEQDCDAACISDVGDGSGGSGDEGPGSQCQELQTLTLLAQDATLDGNWGLVMSMQGEGMVAAIDGMAPDPSGTVRFDVDVPCDDTWHVWVRWFETSAQADTFLATVDGQPAPEAVFEGDCFGGGGQGIGWTWTELNWRDPADDPCVYVQDPWTSDWTVGTHEVAFGFREAIALAQVVVTNDPAFTP